MFVGQRLDQGNRGAITARQVVREDTLATKAQGPNEKNDKNASRRKPSTPTTAPPPNPTLIAHPSNGPGRPSPTGEETQGPKLVDFNLELEAKFPKEMVTEMQGNAAKKAHKTIIGQMLGGRTSLKAFHKSLKLHFPATFVLVTLLTRGYFLILFKNKERATSTRKLTSVEWNKLNLSFSRYTPNFDVSAQGAKALLTHMIKV
ncbi:unnamed protein product [Sphagnum tenellum]